MLKQLQKSLQQLWEAVQVRMYTYSAKRLLGHMRWLLRRRSYLVAKMAKDSRYFVDGYGHFATRVLQVDDLVRQTRESIERVATVVEAKHLVRAREPLQRLVEEAGRMAEQVHSEHGLERDVNKGLLG